jgi:hypothetical protein
MNNSRYLNDPIVVCYYSPLQHTAEYSYIFGWSLLFVCVSSFLLARRAITIQQVGRVSIVSTTDLQKQINVKYRWPEFALQSRREAVTKQPYAILAHHVSFPCDSSQRAPFVIVLVLQGRRIESVIRSWRSGVHAFAHTRPGPQDRFWRSCLTAQRPQYLPSASVYEHPCSTPMHL